MSEHIPELFSKGVRHIAQHKSDGKFLEVSEYKGDKFIEDTGWYQFKDGKGYSISYKTWFENYKVFIDADLVYKSKVMPDELLSLAVEDCPNKCYPFADTRHFRFPSKVSLIDNIMACPIHKETG